MRETRHALDLGGKLSIMSVDGEGVTLKGLMQNMLYEYSSVRVNAIAMFSPFTGERNSASFYTWVLVEASKEHSL